MKTWIIIFAILLCCGQAAATNYYVDFDSGNNANAGTQALPWRNIPGTQSPYGGVTSGWQSLVADDIIYLRAGTTHSSADGGRILIDSTWYGNGTEGHPISIQVLDGWGSGTVTINGTGISGILFRITSRNWIEVKGTATNRLLLTNSAAQGFQSNGSGPSTRQTGLRLRYMDFTYAPSIAGCVITYSDGFEVRDCTASYNSSKGFAQGEDSPSFNDGGKFYDCVAHHNGGGGGGNSWHGFGQYDAINTLYYNCTAYSNTRDGFDFGTTSTSPDNANYGSAILVNSTAYDNGEAGFACNGVAPAYEANRHDYWYINCISYGNSMGWQIYCGVYARLYHCVAENNTSRAAEIFTTPSVCGSVAIKTRNNVFSNHSWAMFYGYCPEPSTGIEDYDYNFYERGSYTGAQFVCNYFLECFTWAQLAAWRTYVVGDAHTNIDVGTGLASNFTDRAGHIYTPTASSNGLLNSGVYITSGIESDLTVVAYAQTDRNGNPRANPPDIGAYEYGSGGTTYNSSISLGAKGFSAPNLRGARFGATVN